MKERLWQEILKDWLHEGIVEVTFRKISGEERWMRCSLAPTVLQMVLDDSEDGASKKTRAQSPEVCVVWDIETEGWRSFRYDTVINAVYNHEEITGSCVITNQLKLVPIHNA